MTIDNLVQQYILYIKNEKACSKHTIEAYRRDLNQLIEFYKKYNNKVTPDITDITKISIRHFLGMLTEKDLQNKSIARKLAVIKGLCSFAIIQGIIAKNPASTIKSPKPEKKLPIVITSQEIDKALNLIIPDTFINSRNKAIIELFYSTGIRLNELISLKQIHVNYNKMLIKVYGKGSKERFVPFGQKAMTALKLYSEFREKKYGTINFDSYLFLSIRGKQISRQMVQVIVKKILEEVSEQLHLSPHVLRHSFASHILDNGAELMTVKDLLGHESLSTTQLYTHVQIGKIKEIYKKAHPHS